MGESCITRQENEVKWGQRPDGGGDTLRWERGGRSGLCDVQRKKQIFGTRENLGGEKGRCPGNLTGNGSQSYFKDNRLRETVFGKRKKRRLTKILYPRGWGGNCEKVSRFGQQREFRKAHSWEKLTGGALKGKERHPEKKGRQKDNGEVIRIQQQQRKEEISAMCHSSCQGIWEMGKRRPGGGAKGTEGGFSFIKEGRKKISA